MRVAGQILQGLLWTPERRLAVDHPVLLVERVQQALERLWWCQVGDPAGEDQLARTVCLAHRRQHLAPEKTRQRLHRHKERSLRRDPPATVTAEPTTRHDEMQVGMMPERPRPSVQQSYRPDLRAEMIFVVGQLQQRRRCATE